MKKFLSVVIAVMMCVCLMAPSAFAADDLASLFNGVDLGTLTAEDITSILGNLNLEDINIEEIAAMFEGEDEDIQMKVEQALQGVQAEMPSEVAGAVSGIDISWLTGIISGDMDTSGLTEMFASSDLTSADTGDILSVISTAMSGAGVDMASFDVSALGSFDITSVLGGLIGTADGGNASAGGGDIASTITGAVSGLADTLLGGLSALGLDTGMIEGLLDNDIVNAFANMYIGFIGQVEESTTATTKPPVVTTTTPNTGDTSSAIIAVVALSVATAAAGVCLKAKKEEE